MYFGLKLTGCVCSSETWSAFPPACLLRHHFTWIHIDVSSVGAQLVRKWVWTGCGPSILCASPAFGNGCVPLFCMVTPATKSAETCLNCLGKNRMAERLMAAEKDTNFSALIPEALRGTSWSKQMLFTTVQTYGFPSSNSVFCWALAAPSWSQ